MAPGYCRGRPCQWSKTKGDATYGLGFIKTGSLSFFRKDCQVDAEKFFFPCEIEKTESLVQAKRNACCTKRKFQGVVYKEQSKIMGRDLILSAIKRNRPLPKPLPVMDYHSFAKDTDRNEDNLVNLFRQQLMLGGGEVITLNGITELQHFVEEKRKSDEFIINTVLQAGSLDMIPVDINSLDKLHQVFIEGSVAVAENAAIWVNEPAMVNRILPFISEQLFLIAYPGQLVRNMHEAYERIKIDEDGFGAFIAGPSKTADIEQSLVIGAHGPKKMIVLLVLEGRG